MLVHTCDLRDFDDFTQHLLTSQGFVYLQTIKQKHRHKVNKMRWCFDLHNPLSGQCLKVDTKQFWNQLTFLVDF